MAFRTTLRKNKVVRWRGMPAIEVKTRLGVSDDTVANPEPELSGRPEKMEHRELIAPVEQPPVDIPHVDAGGDHGA